MVPELDENDLLSINQSLERVHLVKHGQSFSDKNIGIIDNESRDDQDKQVEWDFRFMELAEMISYWSKDSTKVGAIIVDSKNIIISTGYNGFPREIKDTVEKLLNRELKNRLVVHAEMNAIFNSKTSYLSGCTIYVYGVPPCNTCTSSIIRKGISRLVILNSDVLKCHEPWKSSWAISLMMLNEANIEITQL